MPPKDQEKGKSRDRRRRYNTYVVDAATLATLTPFPRPPSSSSQGSSESSQASAVAPSGVSAGYGCPPGFILPTGFQISPHGQTGVIIPLQQQPTPQHQQPPPPQQQQQPPPQQQQGADDDADEEMALYPQDDHERYIIEPSGNS
jgi:hypothetical protein